MYNVPGLAMELAGGDLMLKCRAFFMKNRRRIDIKEIVYER